MLSAICMLIHLVVLELKAVLRMGREGQSSSPLTHVSWRRKSGNVNMYSKAVAEMLRHPRSNLLV